jgi:hypothetical protein
MESGLFTSLGCRRCKASAHEDVVVHYEWAVTKQMRQDLLALKGKDADNMNESLLKVGIGSFYE